MEPELAQFGLNVGAAFPGMGKITYKGGFQKLVL